ncbi:MAG: hypothetical protein COV59_00280 [Candidatus Magasanikbacteria bacterium CG11_big_fil_rev_8_21_14_0_20_39_34]|uniref:Uncharacterized protein n=1 Tax=Candidatus Magasanikbacteria bacterium CG11_big_fil_rev_8_21_14_0_20_39_34 TaxID=1974653 RepID=A0A2H0N6L9_9BACT|nr:MAG: hypothetical protein COV59_00280 [Candidatus Magasanikbacteria bacterium CG11_big_fil_rev_8_21_14_0_20_39_34]
MDVLKHIKKTSLIGDVFSSQKTYYLLRGMKKVGLELDALAPVAHMVCGCISALALCTFPFMLG